MGGNAFDHTRRLSEFEYNATIEQIHAALRRIGISRARVPPALLDKGTHGDIDVMIVTDNLQETTESIHRALKALESKAHHKSMGHILTKDRFQVDLIAVPKDAFDLAVAAQSHGRFIHMLNMTLRKQALAMTEDGLQLSFTKERKHVLSTDLSEIAAFFWFPTCIFDGQTRFTSSQLVDFALQCPFFDIQRFSQLEGREDLLQSPIFATLLGRIQSLDEQEYKSLVCRNVKGENKAGRIAAQVFEVDYDRVKHGLQAKLDMGRKLHGGFFVGLVPQLRQRKDVLKRMPELLLDSVAKGDWIKLREWHDGTCEGEKRQLIQDIVKRETT